MAYNINSDTVIDNNRNGIFNVSNIKSYTKAQLQSVTGEAVGQVVYCSDCIEEYAPISKKLVHWNGMGWVGASQDFLLTGNTYTPEDGYLPGSSTSPSDSIFHDGNAATGVVFADTNLTRTTSFSMTFAGPIHVTKIEYGPWSESLAGTSYNLSGNNYSLQNTSGIRYLETNTNVSTSPSQRRKLNTETSTYTVNSPQKVSGLIFRNTNAIAIANLKVYGSFL